MREFSLTATLGKAARALATWLRGGQLAAWRSALSGGPVGAPGQYGGVKSRIIKKSLNPVWKQRLELRLGGGVMNEDGEYDNNQAPPPSRVAP